MSRAQVILIISALVLIVLLFFAKKQPEFVDKKSVEAEAQAASFEKDASDAQQALTGGAKAKLSEWHRAFDHATVDQKQTLLDSIVKTWDDLNRHELAAFYCEQKAKITDRADFWSKAGEHYYRSVGFVPAPKRPLLFDCAIRCLEKSLSENNNDLDAKATLGACYVEGSQNPMKGIGLLREVVLQDSNHLGAQLNLAFFSQKSGQFAKAIERFKKVLSIKPDYIEAYLFLADAYEKTGDKANAISALEKYYSLVNDITIKEEVQNYINKLKKS